ncbi:MAG: glycogen debranching enzyme family protein [Polyangiaceae bacterium]|nr:glycogen debranching enzyme family protein [Polyangiaceae bacterium]
MPVGREREWLETDGLGGFASGTATLVRTRRYHALLVAARRPPVDRVVLVSGFEAWVSSGAQTIPLTSQLYRGGVRHPDGEDRLLSVSYDPWPRFELDLGELGAVVIELAQRRGSPLTALRFTPSLRGEARLHLRPLLAARGFHELARAEAALDLAPTFVTGTVLLRPRSDLPWLALASDGRYRHAPDWYRQFEYPEELARGLDAHEDLASPGVFDWDLARGPAHLALAALSAEDDALVTQPAAALVTRTLQEEELRRAGRSRLDRAVDAYLARRGDGLTVIAGYPWFGDWGRDTFLSLRGLCLATGRLAEARDILLEWSGHVSEGMLPNRFPDGDVRPEYNSVDAALWYVVVVHELLDHPGASAILGPRDRPRLLEAVRAVLAGYLRGTRHGIHVDADGLVAAGEPGVQLTWMDAKVGDHVVTPRIGKPVEIQALWLAALDRAREEWSDLASPFARALASFESRFWSPAHGHLFDVVDADHVAGRDDASLRPNQLLAVGGPRRSWLSPDRAAAVVGVAERSLVTPLGPRSLGPRESGYRERYEGGVFSRDTAYHQGTVWPWLVGPLVEAWLRVHGATPERKRQARERFVAPLLGHLDEAGIGHVSEIADGDTPHAPRGCPFQAWSVAELLRALQLTE